MLVMTPPHPSTHTSTSREALFKFLLKSRHNMEVLFLQPYQLGGGPKEGVRHVKFKTLLTPCRSLITNILFQPVKGAQNQRGGVR